MPDQETKPKEPEGNLPDPVMDVLKDLKEKVENLKPAEEKRDTTPAVDAILAQREADRKALGFSEEQMQAHERSQMRVMAPAMERTAWSSLEKRPDIDLYKKEIEEELKVYAPERRTPEMLEKIYYFVKGKHADSKPAATTKTTTVERTRVTGGPGYTGNEPSLSGESGVPSGDGELDEKEKFVADKLGIDHKEYAKSKKAGREIRDLRVPDSRPINSLADVELRRMTSKR